MSTVPLIRPAGRWNRAFPLAAAGLLACIGPESAVVTSNLDGLPPDWADDGIVDTTGHPGWTGGEFSVTPDGAATYTIPLWAPTGRAGIEPGLSIEYSSRAGNGPLGLGWTIAGLSTITRCAPTRAVDGAGAGPRPVDFDGNTYCLDGQRLVPANLPGGAPTGRLRPLQNGALSVEIVSNDDDPNHPSSFVVHHPNGRRYRYEQRLEGASMIAHEGTSETQVTYAWLVTQVEDLAGNFMTVEYESPDEARAYGAVEVRPSRMTYTGHAAPDGTVEPGRRAVEFVYRPDVRPDQSLWFVSGLPIASTHLLRYVRTLGPDGTPARRYELAHRTSTSTGRSTLVSVRECDGTPTGCRDPIEFTYQRSTLIGLGGATDVDTGVSASPYGAFESRPISIARDLDGDGGDEIILPRVRADLAPPGTSYRALRYSRARARWLVDTVEGIDQRDEIAPFDREGDGRTELFVHRHLSPPGSYQTVVLSRPPTPSLSPVRYATTPYGVTTTICGPSSSSGRFGIADTIGTGFASLVVECNDGSESLFNVNPGGGGGREMSRTLLPFLMADLDGTTRADLVFRQPAEADAAEGTVVRIQAGPGIDARSDLTLDPTGDWIFIDVNADGLADAINLRDPEMGFALRLNYGNGLFLPEEPALPSGTRREEYAYVTPTDLRIADFNRDGRADLGVLMHTWPRDPFGAATDTFLIHLSNGRGFGHGIDTGAPGEAAYICDPNGILPTPPDGTACRFRRSEWPFSQLFDYDGDGMTDFVFEPSADDAEGRGVPPADLYARRLYDSIPDVLISVTRARVRTAAITYTTQSAVAGSCIAPVVCGAAPLSVATHSDMINSYRHEYAGPRFDVEGRGFLGFARHTIFEPGSRTDLFFEPGAVGQGDPIPRPNGPPAYGERYLAAGRLRAEIHMFGTPNAPAIVTGRFIEYERSTGSYPIAQMRAMHVREWSEVLWSPPSMTTAPPLGVDEFPSPIAAPIRVADQILSYGDFAVLREMTQTIPGVGTTTVRARV